VTKLRSQLMFAMVVAAIAVAPANASAAKTDVLVIGAGLSGLSTAYFAKKAGLTYHVLELSPHVGGRMRSAKYPQGVSAEAGLAEFWEGNPALNLARALHLPEDRPDVCFSSYYYQGKLIPYTQNSNAAFLASLFTPAELADFKKWDGRVAGYFHEISKRPIPAPLFKLKEISFADWVHKDSHMSAKAQDLVRTLTEPEFATSWERISALDGIAEWHIFSGKGTPSHHIKGGNQRLGEALADYVGRRDVEVNRQVTNVKVTSKGVEVEALDPSTFQWHHYEAKRLVSTIPLFRLFEIQFTPALSPKIYEAINTQTWGSYFTAHVILKPAARRFWTVKGESVLPILTGGPVGVIYGGEKQSKQHELLNLLVTGDYAETYNARTGPLDEVRKSVATALSKQWPGIEKEIEQMTFVRYHPRAIASWPVGRSRFDALSDEIRKPHGRLYLAGDFTEGTHSDGAVRSAQRVITQIRTDEHAKAHK
jgi:monoamine oxidase